MWKMLPFGVEQLSTTIFDYAFCNYRKLELPKSALNEADQKDFEVQGYGFDADKEELRSARVVRVGLIQNKILIPTTAPISEQVSYC